MTTRVRRDRWGIPHLEADDEQSLVRLQGRVCARDRAWQLELSRWRMQGRAAERLGADWLGWDVLARQVGLEETARAAYDALDERTRAWVDAYSDGVDCELAAAAAGSAELLAVEGGDVEPWQPWTPLGIFLVHHLLFGSLATKLWRGLVTERLGLRALDWLSTEGAVGGSNAVALAGSRTASGLPLLAGDPHRSVELPGCYAQVRLRCPDFDVAGMAFPGVPGVQHFGHAGPVAWAITNAAADYQDLYREELRPGPGGGWELREADGWRPVVPTEETVLVRDAEPVRVAVLRTARGPVVTGLDPAHPIGDDPAPVHSLRLPCQVEPGLGFEALLPLLHARDVDDVEQAFRVWVEPVNSVVVADRSGRVRHLLAGKVPVRDEELRRRPGHGWDPGAAWEPVWCEREVRDVADVEVNANDRASGGGLGVDYSTPHRAERLQTLVAEHHRRGQRFTAESARALAGDVEQRAVRTARPYLVAASPGGRAEELRSRLLAWDGWCGTQSVEASLWADWRHALVGWLLEQPALAPLTAPHPYPGWLDAALDPRTRVGLAWERLLSSADEIGLDPVAGTAEALRRVAAGHPDQGPAGIAWGERHRLRATHGLGWRGGTEIAVAGDSSCVLACSSTPGVDDGTLRGPVARYVWDLADRRNSGWVVPFGAAGDPASPHHLDQLPRWSALELVPVEPPDSDLTEDPLLPPPPP